MTDLLFLVGAGLLAGVVNALAGGGRSSRSPPSWRWVTRA